MSGAVGLPNGLEERLDALLGPLRDCVPHGVYLRFESGGRWVVPAPGFDTSRAPEESERNAPGTLEARCFQAPWGAGGAEDPLREIWVCAPPELPGAFDAIQGIVTTALEVQGLEQERDALCEELGLSYESLASIYEIGEDRQLLLDPEAACAKILERIVAYDPAPGLEAGLWLVEGEELRPFQWCGSGEPESGHRSRGLLGRSLQEERGLIFRAGEFEETEGLEEVFRSARIVAVSPLALGGRSCGVVAVWSRTPRDFDSRFMNLVGAMCTQAAMVLEDDRLRRDLVQGEALQKEVEISGHIQQSLLQGAAPRSVLGLNIGTYAESSKQIDGDFFGFFPHSPYCLDILVGDVMGKGIPAAMVGAAVKSQFLRYSNSLHASGMTLPPAAPEAIVTAVWRDINPQLMEVGRFVTACYARFDVVQGAMTYVDCGHTNTLQYRALKGDVLPLSCDWVGPVNLPLGLHRETAYRELQVSVSPGDVFLFYSDGITEATSPQGEMFGEPRLAEILREHNSEEAQALVDRIVAEVKDFAGEEGLGDDLTVIVVQVAGTATLDPGLDFLEFSGAPGNLQMVQRFIDEIAARLPQLQEAEEDLYNLKLAVVEAVTNVVRHGYQGVTGGKVRIEAERAENELRIRIVDHGRPFDPRLAADPDLSGPRESGFGLFMIRSLMDEIYYSTEGENGNCLTLVKRFPPQKNDQP